MSEYSASTLTITQQLQRLMGLYERGQASPLLERTVDKLLTHEIAVCHSQLTQIQADLATFEQQYALSSTDFYQQYQAGKTDDRMDYVEWASLVQMAESLQQRLHYLSEAS